MVRRLKDHPALMLWVVGNELDWIPPGRPYHPQLWQRLNDLAIAIHEADPHHPVLTVIGTSRFEEKMQQIAAAMPDMDLLGINAYGDLAEVTRWTRQYWPKPYVVAEWGPTGHWQMPRTPWHVPLEQTSSEKAQAIMQRYQQIIQGDQQNCLGSFVFLWGQKQETTHTWYGMFQDGRLTESVDVMKYLWTGAWPENRSPALKSLTIQGCDDPQAVYLEPTRGCQAVVECLDPDGDQLAYEWDIRPEVEIPANSYAGGGEKAVKPIAGLIEDPTLARIRFKAPATPGPYRLFVRVLDGHNHVAYANVPFLVQ